MHHDDKVRYTYLHHTILRDLRSRRDQAPQILSHQLEVHAVKVGTSGSTFRSSELWAACRCPSNSSVTTGISYHQSSSSEAEPSGSFF